jgi:hypothetical protein
VFPTLGAKDAQNCFLNCLLPKEVASTIDFQIDEIEMEVLHASWTSEFSHSLDPKRPSTRWLGSHATVSDIFGCEPARCGKMSRHPTMKAAMTTDAIGRLNARPP